MNKIRTRYAPSPTGDPHLGNLRTAVFDYLLAKHLGGDFLLRLEDTDKKREQEGSTERILQALEWLGIVPDEGLYLDEQGTIAERGEFGPYTQSKRLETYKIHANELINKGAAYRCFCTTERLAEVRAEQEKNHQAPKYDKLCRSLSREESEQRSKNGEPFIIRQAMPDNQEIKVLDLVRGEISFKTNDLDDQVLLKTDGFPTYQLANVVDDHLMEISHVLRGEEWIPSTPKNILLYQVFGWEPPFFAHMPLILGTDKSKLSKRRGAEPVLAYAERGYLPEAVLNVLAFLGWSPGTEEEIFSLDQLVERFELERVQKSPAIFNQERLDFINGWYIRQLPVGDVAEHIIPYLEAADLLVKRAVGYGLTQPLLLGEVNFPDYILAVTFAIQERLKHFDEAVEVSWFFFKRPEPGQALQDLLVPKKGNAETTTQIMKEVITLLEGVGDTQWLQAHLDELLRAYVVEKGYKNMEVLWPIRAALTGVSASPGTFEMLAILGKEESLVRLGNVI